MLVITCGMNRSGSTLIYNVAKEIVKKKYKVQNLGVDFDINELPALAESPTYFLIKIHGVPDYITSIIQQSHSKILFSYRDPRDVIVSYILKYQAGFENFYNREFKESFITDFNYWNNNEQAYKVYYEQIINNLRSVITDIGQYLQVAITQDEIESIYQKVNRNNLKKAFKKNADFVENGADTYDSKTLLHKNHFNTNEYSSFKKYLSKKELAEIETELKTWIQTHGDGTSLTEWERVGYYPIQKFKRILYNVKEKMTN